MHTAQHALCATQCPPATCNTVVTFLRAVLSILESSGNLEVHVQCLEQCQMPSRCLVDACPYRFARADTPTISVCRVPPYARAFGFALIAKLPPCHISAHDASSVRACKLLSAVSFRFDINDRLLVVLVPFTTNAYTSYSQGPTVVIVSHFVCTNSIVPLICTRYKGRVRRMLC